MNKSYAVGTVAFHRHTGEEGEVHSILDGQEYLMWLNPGEERPRYDVWDLDDMIDNPDELLSPIRLEIKEANEELSEVVKQVQAAEAELNKLNQAITMAGKDRVAQFFGNEELIKRITGVLGMKITHYYFPFSHRSGQGTIIPFEETVTRGRPAGSSYGRMLSLKVAGENGSPALHWALNTYSDGSGNDNWCVPCFSLEEAVALQQKEMDDYLKGGNMLTDSEIVSFKVFADRNCLKLPAHLEMKYWEHRKEVLTRTIGNRNGENTRDQETLAVIEAKLAGAAV